MNDKYIDYESIYSLKNKYIQNEDLFDLNLLIESAFYLEDFKLVNQIKNIVYLKHNEYLSDIESFHFIYFSILGAIASNEYYEALSFINHCEILNDSEYKNYLVADEASFINLVNLKNDDAKLLIICLFILTNKCLIITGDDISIEMSIQYFDMISNLFEIGYDRQIIKELTEIGHILYKI